MVCPNCGAPLPDTVSMCYSCRMVFKPMNQPIQQMPITYNYPLAPTPQKRVSHPVYKPNIWDLYVSSLLWLFLWIAFLFIPLFIVTNSVTKEVYTHYARFDKGLLIIYILLFIIYYALFWGKASKLKKFIQTLICFGLGYCMLSEYSGFYYGLYLESPNLDHETFEMGDGYGVIFAMIFFILLYTFYTVKRDHVKKK